jgi:hypothetical protein
VTANADPCPNRPPLSCSSTAPSPSPPAGAGSSNSSGPAAVLSEPLPTDAPAWQHVPSWFVFGDQDLIIPVACTDSWPGGPARRPGASSPGHRTR